MIGLENMGKILQDTDIGKGLLDKAAETKTISKNKHMGLYQAKKLLYCKEIHNKLKR